VWESEVVALLESDKKGELEAKTVLSELKTQYPERFNDRQLRTLQRRMRDWRAVHGPEREVIFPQDHPPGREAAVDFTHATKLEVLIAGEPLAHLLFVMRLSFSSWTWVQVAFGETFEALVRGVQGALWALGGVPKVLRHDNLSAATHELRKSGGRALTTRFRGVLDHYDLRSTRIRPGKSNENGVVEKGNDLVKGALLQALIVRDDRNFESVGAYETWARGVIDDAMNREHEATIAEERTHLRPLPDHPVPSYTTHHPKVKRWSTIVVAKRTYSLPSRLIGHTVQVRLHAQEVEVRYRGRRLATMPRLLGARTACIDYRHVIGSLIRKPGAFARYRFREELFPTLAFRCAYDALCGWRGERADIEYVRILHLAATTYEHHVACALDLLLEAGEPFDYAEVKAIAAPEPVTVPEVSIPHPDLAVYDAMLEAAL
jgi:transposase